MEPRHSKATRLIKVLIECPRVCCGGGRVAVNCRACVIPVSCALSLSLRVCYLDRSQSKYVLPMVHAFLRFLHVSKIFENSFQTKFHIQGTGGDACSGDCNWFPRVQRVPFRSSDILDGRCVERFTAWACKWH